MVIYSERTEIDIKPCECGGGEPEFIIPNDRYTDCWLECKKCGRHTENKGGFYYASEIPLYNAKLDAVRAWNSGETFLE